MTATAFATCQPLERPQLLAAPIRYPRPSRLDTPLAVPGPKAQRAAQTLGLHTVGDLLEHLPRDRLEARAFLQLVPGESATVVVEVRSIASRSVRRRGMRPLVEATVADDTGSMKAAFFNQPWLVQKYPAGTRLVLHGKFRAHNRFGVQAHAQTTEATAGGDAVAHYPASEGLSSTQILSLVREHADALGDALEPLPSHLRFTERLPDRPGALAAAHFPLQDGDQDSARRRLAFDELLLTQLALLRRRQFRDRGSVAAALGREHELTARWRESVLPVLLTGDQERAVEAIGSDLSQERPI